MTLSLHAQPYDISATGFFFSCMQEYQDKAAKTRNDFGAPVEEFEIQFIDGEDIDCDLAKAFGLNQANVGAFINAVDDWDDDQKTRFIIAVGECGYAFDPVNVDPDDYDVDIYHVESMTELAEQFVEEGLFGDIPENLRFYIDMEAIARDLSMDYTETEIAGTNLVYRCG